MNPEQQEIEDKITEIHQLTDQLIDIELRFAERYMELRRFASVLHAELPALYTRLDRWDIRTQATNFQLERLRDMRDLSQTPTQDPFALERESFAHTLPQSKQTPPPLLFDTPTKPSTEIIALYRSLLTRFYPDIETDDKKRLQRTAIMSKITQAFVDQDQNKLEICTKIDNIPLSEESLTDLVRIVRRIARLRSLCKTAEERNNDLNNSPLGALLKYCHLIFETDGEPLDEIKEMLEELIDKKKFFWLNQQLRSAQLLTEVDP